MSDRPTPGHDLREKIAEAIHGRPIHDYGLGDRHYAYVAADRVTAALRSVGTEALEPKAAGPGEKVDMSGEDAYIAARYEQHKARALEAAPTTPPPHMGWDYAQAAYEQACANEALLLRLLREREQ